METKNIPGCLVLGAAALDIILQVPRFAKPDEIIFPVSVQRMPGGSGANVAAALGWLGIPTAFGGAVGDDDAGDRILRAFCEAGVDYRYVATVSGKTSGGALIAVDPQGERLMYSLGGVALIMEPEQATGIPFEDYSCLYVGEAMPRVAQYAMERMKRGGGRVFFGPGGMGCGGGLQALEPLLGHTDVLFLSRTELAMLAGEKDQEKTLQNLAQKVETLVLTRGAQGARCLSWSGEFEQAAFRVLTVDTTGAGDAFAAGMIAGLLLGHTQSQSLALASACAALTVQVEGARAGVTLAKAQRFLEVQGFPW